MTIEDSSSAIPWLALSVLALPLLSAASTLFIKEKFAWLAPIVSSSFLLLTAICSAIVYFQLYNQSVVHYSWQWLLVHDKVISATILLDGNALIMVLVVSCVSFLVHLFSMGYMAEDHGLVRYFGMLGFFTFAMLGLVMSGNLLFTFFFWELVGFSSYRLIGHWFEKPAAAQASTKAFLINRVGDLGFLIGLMMLWSWFGHLDIGNLNFTSVDTTLLTAAGLCIFLAVIGKSAQFPLFHWLPDAMEGPTPVSALIHAATMVAAGVFLLIRISPLFTEDALMVISITGAVTALIGAWGALVQFDIKKILAYSTISQLGFMVMAIGSGAASGGYLHLLHHAFFKAGLFLGAGAIIHAMHQALHHQPNSFDVQDIRNLGGLRKKLPITFITFLISAAALAGLPLTSGFVSKELILSEMSNWAGDEFSWRWMVVFSSWALTFLTPIYTFRLVWYAFIAEPKQKIEVTEVPIIMRAPLIILAVLSLSIMFNSSGSFFSVINNLLNYFPEAHINITLISLTLITIALAVSLWYYKKSDINKFNEQLTPQYLLDFISNKLISFTSGMYSLTSWIDRYIIDRVIHVFAYISVMFAYVTGWTDKILVDGLVNGTAYSAKGFGALTRMMVNGKIQSYLLWAMAVLVIFILWILY